ncbi:MAG: nickel-dependent lactate racemase [Spirochaetes bacterium]|nr:nickel-dependent lactate racemase [Spirochaetota bacterium]
MSRQSVTIPFGGRTITVDIPKGWRILEVLSPKTYPALDDVRKGVVRAMDSPVDAMPVKDMTLRGKKITLVVDDISRPTPLHRYFDAIVAHLVKSGASKGDMRILMALGVHRPMTREEVEAKLGKRAIRGIQWSNHDSRDASSNLFLGTTSRGTPVSLNRRLAESDLIVCVGAIEPHLLLGFGGGLKMLLPGAAYADTIARNHMQGVSPEMYNYVGVAESPMRLDLEEAAGMLHREIFIVNAVMNENLEICRFVCGHPVAAHREGVRTVAEINGTRLEEAADVAIVASNPMNADLRQGMKCVGNAERCVKENGLILAFLGCEHGVGDVVLPPKPVSHRLLRFILRALGRKRILWFIDRVKKGAGTEERFMAHFSMQAARKNEIYVYSEKLPGDTGERLGVFRQFDAPGEMMAAAARYAPKGATVYVFTHGGATYPVMKAGDGGAMK